MATKNRLKSGCKMAKAKQSVLMMPAACGLAHVMRCICLGKALQEKGCKVVFAGNKNILDLARDYNFKQLYETKDESWKARSIIEIGEIVSKRPHVQ
ncbi:hypothetical protein ACFL2I_02705, partial [Candidatus Omnitrophota bacterium]